MDMDMLVDYCLLMEQIAEMDELRKSALEIWKMLDKQRKALTESNQVDAAILIAAQQVDTYEMVVKLDSRADRKRSLLLQLRQSLYLTPRARSAAVPAKKEKPEEPDELEQLLDNVDSFVNGKRDGK
jgi:translation elongation factor EF-4